MSKASKKCDSAAVWLPNLKLKFVVSIWTENVKEMTTYFCFCKNVNLLEILWENGAILGN